MKTLRFMGRSDDTFGEYALTDIDTDNCGSGEPIFCRVMSGGIGLLVIGQYNRADNGCWDIGIAQIEENDQIPDWPMRFSSEDYSTVLEIDVPDDYIIDIERA